MLLFGAVSASAALNVKTGKAAYNLGDQVVTNYDFSRDQDFSGLLKLSLFCTNSNLDFYTLPTNLNAGQKQEVSVPPLSISASMLGRCYIAANATAFDNSANESSISNFFNITAVMSVEVVADKEVYLPSQSVDASGTVGKSHTLPASVVMSFLGADYTAVVANNTFSYSIKLPSDIRSGSHSLAFSLKDSYGNSGSASVGFTVQAVPTRIVNTLSSRSVKPGDNFYLSVLIYDQADDLIDSPLSFTVSDSIGNRVISSQNNTGVDIKISFPPGQPPGAYTLASTGEGLTESSPLVVEQVESVSVTYSNGTVIVNNTGNVVYAKVFNVTLSGKKTYLVVDAVDMKPGEAFVVDLSNAVSSGEYNISFPTVADAVPVEKTYIADRRSVAKKTLDFIGITGTNVRVVASDSGEAKRNSLPVLFFAGVVIAAVAGFLFLRKKGGGAAGKAQSNGREAGSVQKPVQQSPQEKEYDKVRLIIEEKHRQQMQRQPLQPKTLNREDPQTKKFVRDMMKEKQFR